MDEEGEIALKVECVKHLKENYVGAHIKNYDSMLMLSTLKAMLWEDLVAENTK